MKTAAANQIPHQWMANLCQASRSQMTQGIPHQWMKPLNSDLSQCPCDSYQSSAPSEVGFYSQKDLMKAFQRDDSAATLYQGFRRHQLQVQKGDTLTELLHQEGFSDAEIAKYQLLDKVTQVNHLQDADTIFAGQKLQLPSKRQATSGSQQRHPQRPTGANSRPNWAPVAPNSQRRSQNTSRPQVVSPTGTRTNAPVRNTPSPTQPPKQTQWNGFGGGGDFGGGGAGGSW